MTPLHLTKIEKIQNKTANSGGGASKLQCVFGDGTTLWFAFPDFCDGALEDELADGFLFSFIAICSRRGQDIKSDVPVDHLTRINLQSLIELLSNRCPGVYHHIKIDVPVVERNRLESSGDWVLASGSCGVDALHTLWCCEQFSFVNKPTHLVFNNTGSNEAGSDPARLLVGRIEKSRSFCEENGFGFIYVDSNYSEVFQTHYSLTHLYVNQAIGHFLGRRASVYYCSSGGVEGNMLDFSGDPSYGEPVLLPLLSSSRMMPIHVPGDDIGRYDKIKHIADWAVAQRHLNVCFYTADNCGKCEKCRRVLMALECLDKVNDFGKPFKLEQYYQEQDSIFVNLILDLWEGDKFIREMWNDFMPKLKMKHWLLAWRKRLFKWFIHQRGGVFISRRLGWLK